MFLFLLQDINDNNGMRMNNNNNNNYDVSPWVTMTTTRANFYLTHQKKIIFILAGVTRNSASHEGKRAAHHAKIGDHDAVVASVPSTHKHIP